MANQKHLTLDERALISTLLDKTYSFKAIAKELDTDCTTISKEVRRHILFKRTGCPSNAYNACRHRFTCVIGYSALPAIILTAPVFAAAVNSAMRCARPLSANSAHVMPNLPMSATAAIS